MTTLLDDPRVVLVHALAIEREAAARYAELADQLEQHRNPQVAALFRWLASHEVEHAARLEEQVAGLDVPALRPWDYRWMDPESPEATPYDAAHYRMTAYHALVIARANELRALAFFQRLAEEAANDDVRALATSLAAEEAEHVRYVEAALANEVPPAPGWDDDPDPPRDPG